MLLCSSERNTDLLAKRFLSIWTCIGFDSHRSIGLVSLRLAGGFWSDLSVAESVLERIRMVLMRTASVGKRYGHGSWVFTDVTLALDPGRIVAIGGANGSGKSTLLSVLAGSTRPTSGTISGQRRLIGSYRIDSPPVSGCPPFLSRPHGQDPRVIIPANTREAMPG